MTNGEIAYLALAIGAFVIYAGLLAYGVAVAAERPTPSADRQPVNSLGSSKKAA
jgi:hypothetical protein